MDLSEIEKDIQRLKECFEKQIQCLELAKKLLSDMNDNLMKLVR